MQGNKYTLATNIIKFSGSSVQAISNGGTQDHLFWRQQKEGGRSVPHLTPSYYDLSFRCTVVRTPYLFMEDRSYGVRLIGSLYSNATTTVGCGVVIHRTDKKQAIAFHADDAEQK